jgi:hypothetical protein
MDLNLVGKKEDIVTEFYLMPDVHYLCTMACDIKAKTILATWQKESLIIHMNPYTRKFQN